jgi:hypothetical protein
MRVLYYDVMQKSDAPAALLSGALADRYNFPGSAAEKTLTIDFDRPVYADSIGLGYTDGKYVKISARLFRGWFINGGTPYASSYQLLLNGLDPLARGYQYDFLLNGSTEDVTGTYSETLYFRENGLYLLQRGVVTDRITITTDASYMGRLGAGRAVHTGTAIAKEPSFNNSEKGRVTLSGQRIPGVGGYNYRKISVDTRYKIRDKEMDEILTAYNTQIGPGLPFFIIFDSEAKRLPFTRFYGIDTKNDAFSFESGINKYAFSRKFEFEECF